MRGRILPLGEVFLVTALWASSFVAVRVVLDHAGPLTVASLRYTLAALLLLPWVRWNRLRHAPSRGWIWRRLVAIGVSQYTVGNVALFSALILVTSSAASLALCLTPVAVWILEAAWLRDRLRRLQMLGSAIAVASCVAFFSGGATGLTPAAVGLLAVATLSFAVLPLLGRQIARSRAVDNITLTAVPLLLGGGILIPVAAAVEGIPRMPLSAWGIIGGLATVNTLAAYLLYNHALHRLRAGEANIVLNLIPLGTALIAWSTLGERLTPLQMGALGLAIAGVSLAQYRGK
ncbi:MAG: EamA family transporter [Candidatus Bipolaricaulota bacterium]|nr:MAG: EamA family transporter [Candidatus Bipolaricaulota bacterium]